VYGVDEGCECDGPEEAEDVEKSQDWQDDNEDKGEERSLLAKLTHIQEGSRRAKVDIAKKRSNQQTRLFKMKVQILIRIALRRLFLVGSL
jgi:hypothetical protein